MLERYILIDGLDIRYDDDHSIVIINNRVLRFTPTEYKLMRLLLSYIIVDLPLLLSALNLQDVGDGTPKIITKYMNKIRNKLSIHGIKLCCVHRHGYMLLFPQKGDGHTSLLQALVNHPKSED